MTKKFKIILILTAFLLLTTTSISVNAQKIKKQDIIQQYNLINTLSPDSLIIVDDEPGFNYNNGNPPEDYTTITDAIKAAHTNDIIFVFKGVYQENIVIDKRITLLGEDKTTTIIDGNNTGDVIQITTDNVKISGFTIKNSGEYNETIFDCAIEVLSDNNLIQGNIVSDNGYGIYLNTSKYNDVLDNTVTGNYHGILLDYSTNNTIANNQVSQNTIALCLYYSNNNTVNFNSLSDGMLGMCMNNATLNNISRNKFSANEQGLYVFYSFDNKIMNNNFVENTKRNAKFRGTLKHKNTWNGNYWNRPRILPKIIFGRIGKLGLIGWMHFDLRPARELNNI